MEDSYNFDLLVQFLYHELPVDETTRVVRMLENFSDVRENYEELHSAKLQLPKVLFNPSSKVLHNILQYSTKTAMEAHL